MAHRNSRQGDRQSRSEENAVCVPGQDATAVFKITFRQGLQHSQLVFNGWARVASMALQTHQILHFVVVPCSRVHFLEEVYRFTVQVHVELVKQVGDMLCGLDVLAVTCYGKQPVQVEELRSRPRLSALARSQVVRVRREGKLEEMYPPMLPPSEMPDEKPPAKGRCTAATGALTG